MARFSFGPAVVRACALVVFGLVGAALLCVPPGIAAAKRVALAPKRVEARSIASILEGNGTIRTGARFSGTYNPRGYRLVIGRNGTPHFIRTGASGASGNSLAPAAAVPSPADANWDDRFGLPGVQNDINATVVNALAVSGNDVYVGGIFTFGGGARHAYVLRWDGRSWHDLSGGISGAPSGETPEVDALALSGQKLYVGGIFTNVRNGSTAVAAHDVAVWNTKTQTWSVLGAGIAAGTTCSFCVVRVEAFALSGSNVYAAGSFGKAGTTPANSIALWNGSTWSALGKGLYSCSICSPVQAGDVRTLLISGSTLYAGGNFENAGTAAASDIARWNVGTSTWSSLGAGVVPGYQGGVFALALNGTSLVVGGDFTQAGSVAVNSLAVWTGSAWQALDGANSGVETFSGSQEGAVDALLVQGTKLYVGGSFDTVMPGSKATKGGLASFNLAAPAWSVLPIAELPSTVNSFAPNPAGGVYVGGSFDTGGPLATALYVGNVGILNGSGWSTLGQGVTYGENGSGYGIVLAHGSSGEYLGGWFDQAGPVQTTGIARWDGSRWQKLGSGVAGGSSSTGPTVWAIAVNGPQVFIGGDFTSVGGVAAKNIAVWSGGAWHAVGGGTDGIVESFSIAGGYLYAGGDFTKAGGQAVGAPIARWHLGTSFGSTSGWSALGPLFGAGGIASIAVDGNWVFVGGDLSDCVPGSPCDNGTTTGTTPCETASGFDVNGMMAWNTTNPGSWYYPFGCGVTVGAGATASPGDVTSLLLVGKTLYVGGYFDHAGISGESANQVAAMNVAALNLTALDPTKTTWKALGTGVGNDANGDDVGSLASVGHTLYVGGSFATAGGVTVNGVAQWNTQSSTWSGLGSGLACPASTCSGSYANGVDAAPDGLYVTGDFGTAGANASDNIARWEGPPASNLLTNGSFETAASNGEPTGWTPATTAAVQSTTFAYAGTHSLRLTASGTSSYSIGQQVGGITAGKPYIVSGRVTIPFTKDPFTLTMDVQWLNGTGTVLRTDTVKTYSGPSGGWDEPYAVATPPAGTASARVRLSVANSAPGSAFLYVDDVAFGPAP